MKFYFQRVIKLLFFLKFKFVECMKVAYNWGLTHDGYEQKQK